MIFNNYKQQVIHAVGSDMIGYWPLTEHTGTTAKEITENVGDGTYNGLTLNNDNNGIDGQGRPYLDGVTGALDLYSTALNTAWPKGGGSYGAMVWVRFPADSDWAEIPARILTILSDAQNFFWIENTGNDIRFRAEHANTGDTLIYSPPSNRYVPICVHADFNQSTGALRLFIDGNLEDTGNIATTWANVDLFDEQCCAFTSTSTLFFRVLAGEACNIVLKTGTWTDEQIKQTAIGF